MIDIQKQSQELRESYRRLGDAPASVLDEPAHRAPTAEEARYAASQAQLLWRRFSRNKAAIAGGVVIVLFYLAALFGNFLAPYTLETRFAQAVYLPPQPIHFLNDGKFQPFVYGIKTTFDKNLRRVFTIDLNKKYRSSFSRKASRTSYSACSRPMFTCSRLPAASSACSAATGRGATCLRVWCWAARSRSPSGWWAWC